MNSVITSREEGSPFISPFPSQKENKVLILNVLLRNCSIISGSVLKVSLREEDYLRISQKTSLAKKLIEEFVLTFLRDLRNIINFYKKNRIKWLYDIKRLNRRFRIVLRRIHRIAPVFDYKRARVNLKSLQVLLGRKNFWPKMSTQIAIIIYITDKNDKSRNFNKPILQKNIRALIDCSGYAFHRSRNYLNIH